jgi:pyruvate kinase
MIRAGVDVVRLNFSHGKPEDHVARARLVREVAARVGRPVGILADLQGPKIRVGKFADGKFWLETGERFILDARCELGNNERVGLDYKDLTRDVSAGSVLLLDDGRIVLDVSGRRLGDLHRRSPRWRTVRQQGHQPPGRRPLGAGADRQGHGRHQDRGQHRRRFCRRLLPQECGRHVHGAPTDPRRRGQAQTIAKIERVEAVAALEEIIAASDGIMVARGDLAVEVGDAAVPALQKRMIRLAREKNKLAITATQMMESMISRRPDARRSLRRRQRRARRHRRGDALGRNRFRQVSGRNRRGDGADLPGGRASAEVTLDSEFLNQVFTRIDQTISLAAIWTAHHLKVKAIAALTESGATALWMSRLNCGVPVYALTPRPKQ